ncbi:MAG: hypothetical protein KC561_07485, partial [Myxococcales bacterium]|nr:hypothetical protein [Myxococcales bacterium]
LALAMVYFTFLASYDTFEAVMVFMGGGGEIVFGALCVLGFYYPLPDRFRWDIVRFPVLVVGAYSLGASTIFWLQVKSQRIGIPYGSGVGGPDDPDGDMNRLRFGHHWSPDELIGRYVFLIVLSALALLVHYALFAHPKAPFAKRMSD